MRTSDCGPARLGRRPSRESSHWGSPEAPPCAMYAAPVQTNRWHWGSQSGLIPLKPQRAGLQCAVGAPVAHNLSWEPAEVERAGDALTHDNERTLLFRSGGCTRNTQRAGVQNATLAHTLSLAVGRTGSGSGRAHLRQCAELGINTGASAINPKRAGRLSAFWPVRS